MLRNSDLISPGLKKMRKLNPLLVVLIIYTLMAVSIGFFYVRTKLNIKESLSSMDVVLRDRIDDEVKRLQAAIEDKKKENESLRAGISAYVARQKWLEDKISGLNDEKTKLLAEINDQKQLIGGLEKVQADYEHMKELLAKAKEEGQRLTEYRRKIEPQYRQALAKNDELEKQIDGLKQEQGEKESRVAYNLGVIYGEKGKFAQAIKEYEKAISIDPANALAYYNLGILYENYSKEMKKAMECYKKYLQLQPKSEDMDIIKGWIERIEAQQAINKGNS